MTIQLSREKTPTS